MSTRSIFSQRIGAVKIPVASRVIGADESDHIPGPQGTIPVPWPVPLPEPEPGPGVPWSRPSPSAVFGSIPRWKYCTTTLLEGCYTLSFTPTGASVFATRYRGTLRVERVGTGYRISGDLYRFRLLDLFQLRYAGWAASRYAWGRDGAPDSDLAADAPSIPIYKRNDYHSYLEGIGVSSGYFAPIGGRFAYITQYGERCTFSLSFDQYEYNHPTSGFAGTFDTTPVRSVRYVFRKTDTTGLYSGDAFEGSTRIGGVSIRFVSHHFRKATLQIHTLEGAVAPSAVGTTYIDSIFEEAGWDLRVNDGGTVSMPSTISGQTKTNCWSTANLHRLMSSVPGYDPADLDTVWRSHLVVVQAKLGCGRGVIFDASGDLNDIGREGSATFSDDGYPQSDSPNFGTAQDKKQRSQPRAFLRSATHEVGHAFNQIHTPLELPSSDNSIMTTTGSVANVLAAGNEAFPDDIDLSFNDTVVRHLRHLPDPAVRPGAMDFFGSAVNSPEPADIEFLDGLEISVELDSERVRLGEPVGLKWKIANTSTHPIPVPTSLDHRALVSRISVTDPDGRVTFLRPVDQLTCSQISIADLDVGKSIGGEAVLFYGRDGFTMEKPGKHRVEVIVLWELGGEPVAASGVSELFVSYPISDNDNQVAALLLDPDVGRAVALGDATRFPAAAARIAKAGTIAKTHPACKVLKDMGLTV